jgi:thiamine pyrophosphokinase
MSYHERMRDPDFLVVCNGSLHWTPPLASLCRRARVVIAADGGANALARIGFRPDAVVGDMDSISAETRRWVGDERLVLATDQETTDLEKSLAHLEDASGRGRTLVLGAMGGRLDHIVGNLATLARRAAGADLVYLSDTELVVATRAPVTLTAVPGETWAVWSLDPATRIAVEGLAWPLPDRDSALWPSTSNCANGDRVSIAPTNGVALVMRHLRPTAWSAGFTPAT